MSFLFNSSSPFTQTQAQNQPKVRQEGFVLPSSTSTTTTNGGGGGNNTNTNNNNSSQSSSGSNQPPSPGSGPFDHTSSMFFGQQMYPDTLRRYQHGTTDHGNPMDFGDELASLMAANSQSHSMGHDRRASSEHNGYDFRSPPHDIFGMHHHQQQHQQHQPPQFPTHFSLPHNRGSHLRDELGGTPSSLHSTHAPGRDFYFDHARNEFTPFGIGRGGQGQHPGDVIDTPATSVSSDFNPGGRQSPSTGVSRSRSRSKAATNRTRMPANGKPGPGHAHRTSISSPSPPGHPPSPSSRPQAIVIPNHQHLNGNANGGGHPLSLHHGAGTPSTTGAWFIPTHPSDSTAFGLGSATDANGPQSFSAFAPQNLPLGTSPKSARESSLPRSSTEDAAAKQAALANEKRRRRRESHNAVERRRRDNINEKISELATLIPESMLDPTAKAEAGDVIGGGTLGDDLDGKEPAAIKANKGMILRKSVDYIRYLQQLVTAQSTRNRELESQLSHYRGSGPASATSNASLAFGAMAEVDDTMAGLILANSPDPAFDHHPFGLANLPEESSTFDVTTSAPVGNGGGKHHPHGHQHSHSMTTNGMDTSPSAAGSLEEDEEEEERGRGRGRGINGVMGANAARRGFGGVKEEDRHAIGLDDDGKKMES